MMTRMKIWSLVCALCGAFVGATVGALYQDTGRSMLLGTGIGLAIGLLIGLLLSCISMEGWIFIGDWLVFVGGIFEFAAGIFECCSVVGILSLGFSTMIIMFVSGHHLWISLLAGTGAVVLSIFALSFAMLIDRMHTRPGQPLLSPSNSASGRLIS